MKKLSFIIFLFFILGVAFADSGHPYQITSSAVSNHTDLSTAYLAQVFGTVGNTLQGTTGQMLGMLFRKLNEGILVIAGLWLVYTCITVFGRMASEGSMIGQNKNIFWIFVRIAIAFSMLLPSPATGYSIIQDLVMKVVVEGVSLADQTWAYGLKYLEEGGSLWHRPEDGSGESITQSQAKSLLGSGGNNSGPIQQIFQNEVCMISSSIANNPKVMQKSSVGFVNTSSNNPVYQVVNSKNSFDFPGYGNTRSNEGNNCGSVSYILIGATNDNRQLSKSAVSQLVTSLLPAARSFACSNSNIHSNLCLGVDSNNVTENVENIGFSTLGSYLNDVQPIAQAAEESVVKYAKSFIPNAEKVGWMTAGRYYWDLSQIQSHYSRVSDLSKFKPNVNNASEALSQDSVKKIYDNAGTQWSNYVGTASDGASILGQLSNYQTAARSGNSGGAQPTIKFNSNSILNVLLGPLFGDITGLLQQFATGTRGIGQDPILFLHNIGMSCIAIAGDIWLELAIVIFGITAVTTVCQSTLNLSTPIIAVSDWIKPLLMALAAALLGIGILLGYYFPLYPFMLFTFGVIGWIISVIEAMVAAPLVAFGLTHPEGHDFLGEGKQALMLLLGVFLRPVLMVIGLVSGMILSYVSLRILVLTYSSFLSDLFSVNGTSKLLTTTRGLGSVYNGAAFAAGNIMANELSKVSLGGFLMSFLVFPMMLAIFAMIVYVVVNQCFSLIYLLPDYILRWLGGPQQSGIGSNPIEMVRQVQGGMSQIAQAGGDMITRGLTERTHTNQFDRPYDKGTHSNYRDPGPEGQTIDIQASDRNRQRSPSDDETGD